MACEIVKVIKSFAEVLSLLVSGTFTAVQVTAPYKIATFILVFFYFDHPLFCCSSAAETSTAGVVIPVRIASSAGGTVNTTI